MLRVCPTTKSHRIRTESQPGRSLTAVNFIDVGVVGAYILRVITTATHTKHSDPSTRPLSFLGFLR